MESNGMYDALLNNIVFEYHERLRSWWSSKHVPWSIGKRFVGESSKMVYLMKVWKKVLEWLNAEDNTALDAVVYHELRHIIWEAIFPHYSVEYQEYYVKTMSLRRNLLKRRLPLSSEWITSLKEQWGVGSIKNKKDFWKFIEKHSDELLSKWMLGTMILFYDIFDIDVELVVGYINTYASLQKDTKNSISEMHFTNIFA